jgi:hypothetical protein
MSVILNALERIRNAELLELNRLSLLGEDISDEEAEAECSADCLDAVIEELRNVY